ncbi:hypothetical protein [Oligoflexus tunisiensis]|uniref:hypothetical protein n=1 Tax=Oligoflexus tunisiensis TaxID=708132 RepID=UPI001C4058B4|nr:hypothetical protein [Oligoflexus tunisiensis]
MKSDPLLTVSLKLPDVICDSFEINTVDRTGSGDSFERYTVNNGGFIIGDRGKSRGSGIEYIDRHKAYVLVRLHSNNLPLFKADGSQFSKLEAVSTITEPFLNMNLRRRLCLNARDSGGK